MVPGGERVSLQTPGGTLGQAEALSWAENGGRGGGRGGEFVKAGGRERGDHSCLCNFLHRSLKEGTATQKAYLPITQLTGKPQKGAKSLLPTGDSLKQQRLKVRDHSGREGGETPFLRCSLHPSALRPLPAKWREERKRDWRG